MQVALQPQDAPLPAGSRTIAAVGEANPVCQLQVWELIQPGASVVCLPRCRACHAGSVGTTTSRGDGPFSPDGSAALQGPTVHPSHL